MPAGVYSRAGSEEKRSQHKDKIAEDGSRLEAEKWREPENICIGGGVRGGGGGWGGPLCCCPGCCCSQVGRTATEINGRLCQKGVGIALWSQSIGVSELEEISAPVIKGEGLRRGMEGRVRKQQTRGGV
jgi:hypothetical protein